MMKNFVLIFFSNFFRFVKKVFSILDKNEFLQELKKNQNSRIPSPIKIGKNTSYIISKTAIAIFGTHIDIRHSCNFVIGKNAKLNIGNRVFFNNYCSINCLDAISIGDNTLFGEGVKIYDHNHQYSIQNIEHQKFNTSPISIGKNCWLGSHVIVLKGVTIGDNVIIGAGCVIHKDIPPNSVVINKQELVIKPL